MKFKTTALLLSVSLVLPSACHATTWGNTEVSDPIDPSLKCKVREPMSSGSYIYQWPEKYDQVFWPFTESGGIWFCDGTGFTAFIGDFEGLVEDERRQIASYLKDNYKKDSSIAAQLKLLEEIYVLRKKDERFNNQLLRILARWYQNLGEIDKANAYRRSALEQIQQSLKGNLPEDQRLQYLYIAANYSRFFGNAEASQKYVEELQGAILGLKDKELSGLAEYLSELVKDTPRIKPGRILDPELEGAKGL